MGMRHLQQQDKRAELAELVQGLQSRKEDPLFLMLVKYLTLRREECLTRMVDCKVEDLPVLQATAKVYHNEIKSLTIKLPDMQKSPRMQE